MRTYKLRKRKAKMFMCSGFERSLGEFVEEPVVRDCLRCEKEFVAKGKYNRICYMCKYVLEGRC